jgi:alpha-galactosidase
MKYKYLFLNVILLLVMSCKEQSVQKPIAKVDVALTPPMGWNSYNCFGAAVMESEVRANADFMAKNLKKFGWEYIVIDYCWYYPHPPNSVQENPPQFRLPSDGAPVPWMPMDEYGRLLPDPRKFPSSVNGQGFKPLADYIHSLGLKFGIHLMRGIARQAVWANTPVKGTEGVTASMIADTNSICTWLNLMVGVDMSKKGAQEYYNSLFELYAKWDVDFVKVDNINAGEGEAPYRQKEAEAYRKAIDHCGRPMVLSFSSGLDYKNAEHLRNCGNMWRISNDFWDNWDQLKAQFPLCAKWAHISAPKSWPDADMLPIGNLRLRGPFGKPGKSNFTTDEIYTHLTLWCIFRSPLMIGGNLPDTDELLLKLLTNDEVLEVNQQGNNAKEIFNRDNQVIWISEAPGRNSKYVAFFNLGEKEQSIDMNFADFQLGKQYQVRDLWNKTDLGRRENEFIMVIPPHGAKLYKLNELP